MAPIRRVVVELVVLVVVPAMPVPVGVVVTLVTPAVFIDDRHMIIIVVMVMLAGLPRS